MYQISLRSQHRLALSTFFFLSGFCFSTWASRIPTVKVHFDLNDAQLGNLLMLLPLGSLIGLPVSGWLVTKFESRVPLRYAFVFFCLTLVGIGMSHSLGMLIFSVSCFAFSMRIFNISMNTQSIMLQKEYNKKINGSFHGLWSTGGVFGVFCTTILIRYHVSMIWHFCAVAVMTISVILVAYPYLLRNDRAIAGNRIILGKPDAFILSLGLIVFLSALCEGGMFDWSGIYFREVVKQEIFTLGYLIFMIFMATSRFFSDKLMDRIGLRKTYLFSGSLVIIGIGLVILFPYFWPVLIGFSITGIGVASVIPMTYMLAGRSTKYSPGMAISMVTTYGILGMLLGPSLIGYISHWIGLQYSFLLFVMCGILLIPISQRVFKILEA